MSIQTVITITHDKEVTNDVTAVLTSTAVGDPITESNRLQNWISSMGAGLRNGSIDVQVNNGTAVQASGTITFTGASTANDTVLINGVTFTAVASGATGNQWNIGTTATTAAANLVLGINGSVTSLVAGYVTASNLAGVLTITAVPFGISGNTMTIAKGTDAGSVMTVSGARLTAGAAASANTYKYGV